MIKTILVIGAIGGLVAAVIPPFGAMNVIGLIGLIGNCILLGMELAGD